MGNSLWSQEEVEVTDKVDVVVFGDNNEVVTHDEKPVDEQIKDITEVKATCIQLPGEETDYKKETINGKPYFVIKNEVLTQMNDDLDKLLGDIGSIKKKIHQIEKKVDITYSNINIHA